MPENLALGPDQFRGSGPVALVAPRKPPRVESSRWSGQGGQATAEISRKGATVTLAIDRDPSFGNFVAARLDELYAAFLDQQASEPGLTSDEEKGPGRPR